MSDAETGRTHIFFSGEVTIRTIADAYERLSNAVFSNDEIFLDLSGLTEVDLSFVQLVVSARRTAYARGKVLSLVSPVSCALRDVLRRGGLCGEDGFWGRVEVV